jgi:hypothetical protein
MNAEWHAQHVMPKNAKLPERIAWHRAHQKQCACRPIPAKVAAAMKQGATKPAVEAGSSAKSSLKRPAKAAASRGRTSRDVSPLVPQFARIVSALEREADVSYGGKGFGSSALKHNGKIFAMLTSKQKFVVKLTKERVNELVKAKHGRYFDPGHVRLMKEWLELFNESPRWQALAKEALALARG